MKTVLRMLLVGLLLAYMPAILPADEPAKNAVTLVVDYGDGVEKRFTELAWKSGWTIADALQAAQQHPRGIKVVQRGSGATAFLMQIDDLKNSGTGKNWIYRVNGRLGDRSFATYELKAGDVILWAYTTKE